MAIVREKEVVRVKIGETLMNQESRDVLVITGHLGGQEIKSTRIRGDKAA